MSGVATPRTTEEIKLANLGILNMLDNPEGVNQVGEEVTNAIRMKIREEGYLGKILERKPVTVTESQRYTDRDGLYMLVDKTENTTAAVCTLIGEYAVEYITGHRVQVPMYVIRSKRYEKAESELIALDRFIINDVVRSLYYSIELAEDQRFITLCDAIITGDSTKNTGSSATTLTRADLAKGLNKLVERELRCQTILMPEVRANDILAWNSNDIGFAETTEIFYNGLRSDTIFKNIRWISSLKTFMNPKRLYYFAHEDYLGRFFEWRPVKVYVEKRNGIISFWAEEWIGYAIINTNAVTSLTIT